MKPFQFAANPRLVFGAGRIALLPDLAASLGSTVLIVTGASFRSSDRWDRLLEGLDRKKIRAFHYPVSGEPSPETVDTAVRDFRSKAVHAVVSIGGGSAIDAGKAISAMLPLEGSVVDYLEGVGTKKHDGVKAPFIACPTTAGTGSEATKNAVLSRIGKNGFKKSLRHDSLVPDIALVDPELTLGCPEAVTAAGGLDALTQLLESFCSPESSPMTDALALEGLSRVRSGLIRATQSGPEDLEARSNMSLAAYLSGLTLANAGLGVVHGIASVMGGLFEIPHGVICGTLLAAATDTNMAACRRTGADGALAKFANAGRVLSGKSGLDDAAALEALSAILNEWTEILEIPRLGELGIKPADTAAIAAAVTAKNNAAPLEKTEIAEILARRI